MKPYATWTSVLSALVRPFRAGLSSALWLGLMFALLVPTRLLAEKQLYTCGMHPQIVRDEPGNCPICSMKLQPMRMAQAEPRSLDAPEAPRKIKFYKSTMLPGEISKKPGKDSMGMEMVPVYEDAAQGANPLPADAITVDPQTIQEMNFKTSLVERGPAIRTLRTVGIVAYDERGLSVVTTRFDGWIDKLDVDATWTSVKAGQTFFEIYSPELYNAELNYLVALRAEPDASGPLTHAALQRLRLLDVSEAFIAEIARTGQARRDYPFPAPATGVVTLKNIVVGQMVRAGEPLFHVADLSRVWVNAQLYERDLMGVAQGQAVSVRMTYGMNTEHPGTIEQILPQVENDTRSAIARIVLTNPRGMLRPGMFAEVRIPVHLATSALLVPNSAVVRSGEENVAFVALPGGVFEPRKVVLGGEVDGGRDIVLSGLKAGERVVTSGEFMLDSESQLQEAIQKMLKPTPETAVPSVPAKP
ncbi:cation efflux system protein CusB precursor [mine drainage metagenome]|uniref:Cation efflux system protein CusB n=1 Tax=mine drainage metagenome TaxID=410659 RepID=A0A1J5SR66_9ZZZZ